GEKGDPLWVRRNILTIESRYGGEYKVHSGGGVKRGKRGFPVTFACIDELAEFESRDVFMDVALNVRKRKDSALFTISTAGNDVAGIGKEQFDYCQRLLRNEIIDITFLPVVYA